MTTADVISKVTAEYLKWVDYTEKSSYSYVKDATYDNPGDYNAGAGSNNYTVFAKIYAEKTGISVQGQPWCDVFVDTILIHLFGVSIAKQLLGGFSAYTPTSANYFKNMDRWHTSNPQEGDIIFFKNSTRIYHTGYVRKVSGNYVYTVEGNTSTTNNSVEANGGCVAKKYYLLTNSKIAGYGRPDYSICLEDEEYVQGWMKAADNVRWWYQFKNGTYALNDGKNNGWYTIDDYYYLFDKNGYMLTGVQEVNGYNYMLCPTTGSDEGKLMSSYGSKHGVLTPWNVSELTPDATFMKESWEMTTDSKWKYKYTDGSYATGWASINGYYYYFDSNNCAVTGWQTIGTETFYFGESGNNEGKLMSTYGNIYGTLNPWNHNT